MTTYAYLRVSTDQQDQASQRSMIDAWSDENKRVIASYVTDTASGATAWQKRSIGYVLDKCEPHDVIVVSEISRIARSILGVLSFLAAAAERQVTVVAIRSRIQLDGSMQSKIVVTVLALAAEIERDLIRERTKAALSARRAAGLPLGRPTGSRSVSILHPKRAEIAKLLQAGVSKRAVARVLSCSPSTLYAYLATPAYTTGDIATDEIFPKNQPSATSAGKD